MGRVAPKAKGPTSLLCYGTPQAVKNDVRELIEIFGDNGGLIVDGSMGIPDKAKPENVSAMREAVAQHGIFVTVRSRQG